jgi:2-amino-4-hydroxy-6-hydroxymethyldihydropteridine diphosphokinase
LAHVYLALGANMGNRKQNLRQAVKQLSEKIKIEQVSPVFETDPVGFTAQPLFLNMALRGTTSLKPPALLSFIKNIEISLGRVPSFANAPRPMDIDILFYDDKIINSKELVVPHPRLTVRAFVLVPLSEISPGHIHPGNRRTVKHLLKDLGSTNGVHRWGEANEIWEAGKHV